MSLTARSFAAVILAAGCMVMPTLPASGSPNAAAAQVTVYLPDVLVGAGSEGTIESVFAGSSEPVELENFTLAVDYSGLAGVATVSAVSPSSECKVAGTVLTCISPFPKQLYTGLINLFPQLAVKPAAGAAVGASGKWKATISADGVAPASMEATVTVAEGVDLGVPTRSATFTSAPGATLPYPLEINNVGAKAADGSVALIYGDYAFSAAKQYSNCTYVDDRLRSCTFDEQLAVGTGYATHEPVQFRMRPDTQAPGNESLEVEWVTPAELILIKKRLADLGQPDFFGTPGTGDKLRLVAKPTPLTSAQQVDIRGTNDFTSVTVEIEGDNDADIAAIGGSSPGAAGEVVTLNLGVKNLGPATLDLSRVGENAGIADITLPPGSSLAEMPEGCVAMTQLGDEPSLDPNPDNLLTRFIRCRNDSSVFKVGTEKTFPVKLRIDQVIANATGTVVVGTRGCDCGADRTPGNDSANVVLNPPALPITGIQVGLIAATGGLLIFGGLTALVLARRRRFIA